MPSNKELTAEIKKLAEELKVDAPATDGKNNNELANMVSELRNQKKEADKDLTPGASAQAAAEAKAAAEAAKKEATELPPYSIADGKAITCKKGILAEGDEVKAAYLSGGEDTLKGLVKSGHVVKA